MTETDILQAKTRALNVLNGFVTIRQQQATDALKLAEALQEANRRLREIETKSDQAHAGPDDFGQYFSELMRGKGG